MTIFIAIISIIVWGCFWGFVTNKVIGNKGYSENWFLWGFFFGFIAFIVALTKPDVSHPITATPSTTAPIMTSLDEKMLKNGGWKCTCGRINPSYTGTCACGRGKADALKEVNEKAKKEKELENLKKIKEYKELLDSGIITEEEFAEKKKELLG